MPWIVRQDSRCRAPGKSWAVIVEGTNRIVACHATEHDATQQQKALYAKQAQGAIRGGLPVGGDMGTDERGAIGSHSTGTTDAAWDGPGMVARLPSDATAAQLRAEFAWVDSSADPTNKGSYKFPHHMVGGNGQVGAANLRACSAAIAILNGGRGGANIPDGDRRGIYAHLAGHLRSAGRTPPELASIQPGQEMLPKEMRFANFVVEIRAVDGGAKKISGYAAVFEKPSQNLGGFIEVVTRSFFNKSRGDGWPGVMARWNHDDALLLGTADSGTLQLGIDDYGLRYDVDPPKSRADLVELVERRDIRRSSMAFRIPPGGDDWGLSDQGYPQRSLVSGLLIDVAPVNSPAYLDTTVGLRSLAEHMGADFEEVRSLAELGELRRFFVRTDKPGAAPPPARKPPPLFGPAALTALDARREDPFVDE